MANIFQSLETGGFFKFKESRTEDIHVFVKCDEKGEEILAVNLLISPEPKPQNYIFSKPFESKLTQIN